ncbi:MAG: alpha/beta hydrolase [Alphaproteobacteria bacterium]|jgi:arylformamidase
MSDAIYRGHTKDELDQLYSQRHRIDGYDGYLKRWPAESAAARASLDTVLDVRYGPNDAETYDVFRAGPSAPVQVFVHGGYWYSQDKTVFESMAPAFVARGATLVSINYPLAPSVTMTDIVESCRTCLAHIFKNARTWGGDPSRLYVSGHSAGGHLAATLISTDWPGLDAALPDDMIKGAMPISGLYDLEPIRHLTMNETLGITEAEVQRLSPILAIPAAAGSMIMGVGTNEGAEFSRQQADYVDAWRAGGLTCEALNLEGLNHFSIVDDYSAAGGTLFEAACAQMGLSR